MTNNENETDPAPVAKEPAQPVPILELFEDYQMGLSDQDIAEICDALYEPGGHERIESLIDDLSIADTADLLMKIDGTDREKLVLEYGDRFDPEVFAYLDAEICKNVLETMPSRRVASIISDLDSDDALDLILNLDPVFQQEIIRHLSAKDRIALEEGLSFPEDSAGRLMQREFVAIPQFWTVGKTIDYLRAAADELPYDFFDVIVITPTYHVVGEIPLNKLIRAKRSEKIQSLVLEDVHIVPAAMDQEEVAHMFRREGIASAPVIDEDGRLIGVITIDDVVDVIDEEAQEDIMKMAGVGESDLYRPTMATTAIRFKWLAVNLVTAILASGVVALFDSTIQQIVALAVLMPIVASMGGNAGTQAMTVAVRALATKELSQANTMRLIWKETLVGTLNGAAFALIMGAIAALWFQNPMLGAVIGSAMIINLFCAGLFGAGIPVILDKLGSDPAISSSIFLTTVTDVIGFLAFLGLAALFLI